MGKYGFHLRGLPKKIASFIVVAKTATFYGSNNDRTLIDDSARTEESIVPTWTALFESYDQVKGDLKKQPALLPRLSVRVAKGDKFKILNAEKNLSFKKR